jgi:ankyrin repeat protein
MWQNYGTALHRAVQCTQEQAAEYLLQCNANVETVDSNGWTALHYAAQAQEDVSGLMSKLLLAGGQNATVEDDKNTQRWQEIRTI